MPRQLISKKCWKPLQGKGISQKSAHLINLTSALTVYTRTLRRPKKCTLFFQSPRFYIVVIVSQRRNLALICYGRKDIEDDFKRITKRFLNVKLKHIWHMRCSTLHRYFILHENLFFMNSICSKWFLLRSCTVVVFICFGVNCPDFGLNGIKTGDILLCFNPWMLELLPFIACWWCLKSKCHSIDSCSPFLITFFTICYFPVVVDLWDVFTLTTWNAENNILHNVIQFIPFVTYPLFTFLLPCFWLGNRPRKFQSWYTCNLSYFKFVAGYIPLSTFSFWNL